MPHQPRAPQHDRFFARLDKFELECPNCGRLIYTAPRAAGRGLSGLTPSSRKFLDRIWNPCTQQLTCPSCRHAFVAGLIVYPVPVGLRGLTPPPDVVLTAREVAVSRQRAGGWYATRSYRKGEHVNVAVTSPCSCPRKGWSVTCPVHGDPGQQLSR